MFGHICYIFFKKYLFDKFWSIPYVNLKNKIHYQNSM